MKNNIVLLILMLLSACKKHDDKWEPPPCEQSTFVLINGVIVKNCIGASVNRVSEYSMSICRYENGLKYNIGMTILRPYRLSEYFGLYNDSVSTQYEELCCESMPDQTNKEYYIYKPDSLNSFLRLHLDTVNQIASGMLKATYINQKEPYDLVYVQCDTFYCKYTKN